MTVHPRTRWICVFLALSVIGPACRGWDGGRLYKKRIYPRWRSELRDTTYRVGLPGSGWQPHKQKDAQVAWERADGSGLITARAVCEEHGDRTLEQFLGDLQLDFKNWKVQSHEYTELARREALRVRLIATLDGVPFGMEAIVVKKNGCLFDFWYMAPESAFERGLSDFVRFVGGFEFPVS